MKVMHVIAGLNKGGAEGALFRLVVADGNNEHIVVSLMDEGYYGSLFRRLGVQVHALGWARGRLGIRGLFRLYGLIRSIRPDVVQTWMYHADLIAGAVAKIAGRRMVVWGIRHSSLEPGKTSAVTRIVARICAILSGILPARIVSCSEAAAKVHVELGYDSTRMTVVQNGFDLHEFLPQVNGRSELRNHWGAKNDECVFGMVARWDPQKDHAGLIQAFTLFRKHFSGSARCVLVGTGVTQANQVLVALLEEYGVQGSFLLFGPRDDIPALMSAFDVHVLSSSSEAFPNVVAEAMACGTPCIATDVGDAAQIVGDAGWVVPPMHPAALAGAMLRAAHELCDKEGWKERKEASRKRIQENFSVEKMASRFNAIWSEAGAADRKKAEIR